MKTRSSKNRKIDIFPKGITHGFGPKKPFFQLVFFGTIGKKRSFTIFKNEKTPFEAIKTTSSKKRKMAIFPPFFFQAIQARKMSFTIFSDKKATFQVIKTRTSKSRKIDIFPKGLTHGLSPKMAIFPTLFLGNIGQENVFYDILEREKLFSRL